MFFFFSVDNLRFGCRERGSSRNRRFHRKNNQAGAGGLGGQQLEATPAHVCLERLPPGTLQATATVWSPRSSVKDSGVGGLGASEYFA